MQLGISSYTYGWNVGVSGNMPANVLTELDLVEKSRGFDIGILQLGDNLPLHLFDKQRLELFKNSLKQNNIQLEIGARGMTDEQLTGYIHLAADMGSGMLRFVIDDNHYEPSAHEIIRVIRSHTELLVSNKITLALENHDRLKVAELAAIIKEVNSEQVGICLDTANSLGAGESIEAIVDALAPYTVNLHLKDFGIQRLTHKMGFITSGRIAGEGMLNIPWLLQKIKSYQRCRTAILEQWVTPEDDIKSTVAKEEQWARKSVQYLKTIEAWEDPT